MARCFIGLGSNLGQPAQHIRQALASLQALEAVALLQFSTLYRSAAVGPGEQPDYCNAVAEIETSLAPHELLDALQAIEEQQGRVRDDKERWLPRTLDLDLLLYEDRVLEDARLQLPHPRISERNFVLVPLQEIAPDAQIPGLGRVSELCAQFDNADIGPWEDNA